MRCLTQTAVFVTAFFLVAMGVMLPSPAAASVPSEFVLGSACVNAVQTGDPSGSSAAPLAGESTTRNRDAERVPPGFGAPPYDLPIVSDTSSTFIENGLTRTTRTVLRYGVLPEMAAKREASAAGTSGALAGCSYVGTLDMTREDSVCGGGCMTQYMRRYAHEYTTGTAAKYWDRQEVRLWWVRRYDDQIDFNGPAYTQWNEQPTVDCAGSQGGRQVGSNTSIAWNTWDRTWDYVWDETWLKTEAIPAGFNINMYVYTRTPTTYGVDMFTEIYLPN